MIDITVKYSASIFLDASNIKTDSDTIAKLLADLKEFNLIPSYFNEISGGSLKPQLRPQFSSPNGEWRISLGFQRLDFEKQIVNLAEDNIGNLSDFCNDVVKIYNSLSDFNKKRANRFSLVTRYFLKNMDTNELNSIHSKLFNVPNTYQVTPPFEWNWRNVTEMKYDINNSEELFNVISILNRVSGKMSVGRNEMKDFDRVELSIDINSTNNNKEFRFEKGSIEEFYGLSHKWESKLLDEIVNFLN